MEKRMAEDNNTNNTNTVDNSKTVESVKQVIALLQEILNELPAESKNAAEALIKSFSIKEAYSAEDFSSLVESLQEFDKQFGKVATASPNTDYAAPQTAPKYGSDNGKMTISQLRGVIAQLLNKLMDLLSQIGYKRYPIPAKESIKQFISNVKLIEAVTDSDGSKWGAVLIEAGMSANKHLYRPDVLRGAVPLFEGIKAYVDHPGVGDRQAKVLPERSVRDIGGWFQEVSANDKGDIIGTFTVAESQPWLKNLLLQQFREGKQLVGFSILADGKTKLMKENGNMYWLVESIDSAKSCDIVTDPAAGGRIKELIEADRKEVEQIMAFESLNLEELKASRPDLVAALIKEAEEFKAQDELAKQEALKKKKAATDYGYPPVSEAQEVAMTDEEKKKKKAAEDAAMAATAKPAACKEDVDALNKMVQSMAQSMSVAESRATLRESLATSQLPKVVQDRVFEEMSLSAPSSEAISARIKKEKDMLAKLVESKESPFKANLREMTAPEDKWGKAMDGMLSGKAVDGVKPFRGLLEAFSVIKGRDYGDVASQPEQVLRESTGYTSVGRLVESIASTDWAEILGDSITRKMLKEYQLPALDDWKKICSEVGTVNDFRTQRRVRYGGYGVLPAVGEGGTYQNLTSPTDEEVTFAVSKRGGLEDLTIETIINDDLGAVKRIPTRLARAAKITLYRFIFDFLDTNAAIYDGAALFTTGGGSHLNLGGTALSSAQLIVAKYTMRDQTGYGQSTEFLQIKPKYLIVPNELEATAGILATAEYNPDPVTIATGGTPATAFSTAPNIHRGTVEPIVVDYWTDTNNWYLVADPQYVPTIEISFLGGKQEPELFTQDQPTQGSVWSADKISYKLRHVYGGAVVDYRGFWGAIL
jgi:hypothetical protein